MLERIALHQTRLRTPGLGLDGKGVALGAKGLVLLPSIDRLVAWLSVYTRERSLEDLLGSIELRLVRSKLGTREITLEFAAESSDRMDRIAETSRLVGGFSFTGTSRHFVQYRDAAAPFGYDAAELMSTDSALALYHDKFTQVYDTERSIELRSLLLRLMPHVDPSTGDETGPRYVVAERGLGPALIHYFVRSKVDAEVGVVEWPPESAFDETAVQRYLFRVPDLPMRMRPLLYNTPGLTTFLPAGPGIAVEVGHRHPVSLRACPIFPATGLVLIRGEGKEPWNVTELPAMGDIRAFARVELRQEGEVERAMTGTGTISTVRVPLRVVPSTAPWRNIVASWLTPAEIPMLRKLAYALPTRTIAGTRIAITSRGAFLKCPTGIEGIPLGTLFYEIHPQLFIPAGFDVTPAIAPDVLYRALGASSEFSLFVTPDARSISVEERGFSPFENAIIEARPFEPLMSDAIERALTAEPITLQVEGLGLLPLRGVAPPDATEGDIKALPSGDPQP